MVAICLCLSSGIAHFFVPLCLLAVTPTCLSHAHARILTSRTTQHLHNTRLHTCANLPLH
eukprot:m.13243 g.13243  ORF g.13243 m.13243 type:complete len:60 (+) comp10124_c0_seq1:64-243(+)